MNNSQIPAKIPTPWANAGIRNTIPGPSQIAVTPGAASFTDGFPPLNATAISAGGIPPAIGDMNGALYDVTVTEQWLEAGGGWPFDATFATAIGGYPSGAVIPSADGTGWWRNTADNNSANPDTGGAGWVPHFFYGIATQALAGANVTLTAAQYSKPQIVISGALTANVQLVFPAMALQWLVVNNCTGAFTVTATTSGGSGVALTAGANQIYGDGTNIRSVLTSGSAQLQNLATNGYQRMPGGLVLMWGTYSPDINGDGAVATVTFSTAVGISFPTACLNATVTTLNPTNDTSADGWIEIESWSAATLVVANQWGGGGSGNRLSHGFSWFAIGY